MLEIVGDTGKCAPALLQFDANLLRPDTSVLQWKWDFGNGQSDTTANPFTQYYFIPAGQTSYLARLVIMDTADCTDTAYHIIYVEDNCYIAVPSAFTPNGDGLNDYLYPANAYKATNLLFRVYNRAGQVVFETNNPFIGWDGTYRGTAQPMDVYAYTLDATFFDGTKTRRKGDITLIR